MKNFIKKLCPLFLGPVLLTAIAQSILASDERTDLMIGCDEYKPYNYFDENGNLVGIDADLAEEACHRMGYEPVYIQYNATFLSTYVESGVRRITLAEKLRKISLSFFGKKDLSDLTSTIMADCATLETASSHWIPELVGACISTALVAVSLFFFDWRMAIAALWVLPVSFLIVGCSGNVQKRVAGRQMDLKMACADGIQECLETVRDLRANNALAEYIKGLDSKIRAVEKHAIVTELTTAVFVASAQMILKFGIATTALVGSVLLAEGKIDPETLMSLYSIVFQDVTLFNNTIMENIRIGRQDATDEEVIAAAKLAHYDKFAEKLPDGWNTMIGENGSELSGGERQRISIARAFLKDAPIILLDEATASLDVDNETMIQESLSRLIRNKTVMIIAHRMRTVADTDKIVVLKDGVVAEQGSPAELAKKNGIYQHMMETQMQAAGWKL